jgi:hypothetical protein
MAKARVFIVQDSGRLNFTPASRFGELIPLVGRDVYPDDADERVHAIRIIMKSKLAEFNPAKDFLLLTGDPVAIVMAVLTLAVQTLTIRCLKWDNEHKGYFPVEVSV